MEKETLYKFFDGKASREEKESVRIWLESSPENEQELFKEREFFDAMILSGSTKVAGMEKKSRPFYRTVLLEAIKIAAVFAITVASGTYFYKSEICKIGEAMSTITVPAGQRANLTLPDGTNVWLNARSEMRYPAVFTGNKREITLDGEAYFEVTHNEDKPFVVQTNKCNVEVLGTKFNVAADEAAREFSTALLRGRLRVTNKLTRDDEIVMNTNDFVSLSGDRLALRSIENTDDYLWPEGIFNLAGHNFGEIIARLESLYDVTIAIEKTARPELNIIRGKIPVAMGLDYALRALQKITPFEYESADNGTITIR